MESGRENGRRMAKGGENRFWEAFCPLHMHAITQAAMQARPQAAIQGVPDFLKGSM